MAIVFAGPNYYPEGGWLDFIGETDTTQEAVLLVEGLDDNHPRVHNEGGWAWAHIVEENFVIAFARRDKRFGPLWDWVDA